MSWKGGPYSENFPEREAARMVAEGLLRLDPDGSVWRLKKLPRPGEGTEPIPCEPHRIDYPTKRGNRYFDIRIARGRRSKVQVARFIWQLHKGDIPARLTVNHKDGRPWNDSIENYELMTHSEQHKHRYRVLGQEAPSAVNKRLLEQFVAAAIVAADGDLGPLAEALEAYKAHKLERTEPPTM